jgi:hypothetical protein
MAATWRGGQTIDDDVGEAISLSGPTPRREAANRGQVGNRLQLFSRYLPKEGLI